MTLTISERSAVSRRTWRSRKREGGKAVDPVTGKPIFAGGKSYKGALYHKVTADVLAQAHRIGLQGQQAQRYAAELLSNPVSSFGWVKTGSGPDVEYRAYVAGMHVATVYPGNKGYHIQVVGRASPLILYPNVAGAKMAAEQAIREGSNPRSAPGKSTRPPSAWMAHMLPGAKRQYPRRNAKSISRIIAGIWHKYPRATQDRLIAQYEDAPRNPGAAWHREVQRTLQQQAIGIKGKRLLPASQTYYDRAKEHGRSAVESDRLGMPNPTSRLKPLLILGAALLGLWWWSNRKEP